MRGWCEGLGRFSGVAKATVPLLFIAVFGAMCLQPEGAAAKETPIAAYSFDAGEGATAEDVTGNEHDGEIEGASWFDNGKYGSALSFDGENDCVTVADAEDLRITEELTVEAWVKPSSLSDGPVIYKDAWGNKAHALGIGIFEYGKPEAFIGEGEGEFESVVSSKAIEANVWSHLAFTYDGGHMRLYVDGELVASKAQSEGPPWGEGDLVIGCNPNYPEHFEGLIDEVRVYNRALGSQEAKDITAPFFAPSFYATPVTESGKTTVVTAGAYDSDSPRGQAPNYVYRYGINSEPASSWKMTDHNYFTVATPEETEDINFEIYATDAAGNRTRTEVGTVSALPIGVYEPTETEISEAEAESNASRISDDPFASSALVRSSSNSSLYRRGGATRPGPGECAVHANDPHPSIHAKQEGFDRINATAFVWCGLPDVTGTVTSTLMQQGPYGSYPVGSSGPKPFGPTIPYKRYTAIIKPFDCKPGRYYTRSFAYLDPSPVPGTRWETALLGNASGIRTIEHC
jgi:Concanavalin A-like lectin/glucanases superfamily